MQHDKRELCNLPGKHLSAFGIDLMHVILLGILQIAIGGVLWESAFDDNFGPAHWVPGGWKVNAALRLRLTNDVIEWRKNNFHAHNLCLRLGGSVCRKT